MRACLYCGANSWNSTETTIHDYPALICDGCHFVARKDLVQAPEVKIQDVRDSFTLNPIESVTGILREQLLSKPEPETRTESLVRELLGNAQFMDYVLSHADCDSSGAGFIVNFVRKVERELDTLIEQETSHGEV